MRGFLIAAAFLAGSVIPACAQMDSGNDTNVTNNTSAVNASNTTGIGAGASGGMSNSSISGCQGMNTSTGNNTSEMNNTSSANSSASGSAYSMGVSKNETESGAGNASSGLGAGLGNNTSMKEDLGGMNTSLQAGALTSGYSFDQKDQLAKDVQDQVKQLDLKIDEAKRHGDNDTARLIKSDRERLKKQVSEIKKSNKDNWDTVQNKTMSVMGAMNITQ